MKANAFEEITVGYNIINYTFRKEGLEVAATADMGVVTMNPLGGGMLTLHKEMLSVFQDEDRWFKGKRASDCTQCGECEEYCTQKLPIREYLANIAEFLGEK